MAFLLGVSILLAPTAGRAAEANSRWIPALAVVAGAQSIDTDASVSSIRGDIDRESRAFFGFLGLDVQLATPVLFDSKLEPRLFIRGGVASTFDGEERIANDGSPGEIEIPIRDNNGDGIPDEETPVAAVKGLGSATTGETLSPAYTAAIGLDLMFEVLERRLHVKPSLEWIVQQDRVTSLLGYAEKFPTDVGNPDDCPCRTAAGGFSKRERFHGLGPGLELELEATRIGQSMVSVFAGAQAYYNFNRRIKVGGQVLFDDGVTTTELRSTYERKAFDYRVGWGIRFHWLPD